jgi:LPXTG-motif cell wall-anchored protein
MRTNLARRYLAGLAVAGAILAVGAVPAAAQEPPTRLGVYFLDTTIAAGSAGKLDSAILYASKPVVLHEATVRYDFTDLAGKVTIGEDDDRSRCTSPAANVLLCTVPYDIEVLDEWGLGGVFDVRITPEAGAKKGDEGVLKVTFGAAGFGTVTHDAKIRIGEGVDLAAGPDLDRSAAPGGKVSAPLTVRNAGSTTAKGASVIFFNDYAIRATKHFSNCTYEGDKLRACHFEDALQPGNSYSAALTYALGTDTYAPSQAAGETNWMTAAEFEDFAAYLASRGVDLGKPGNDGELTLAGVAGAKARGLQADTDPTNNWSSLQVTVTGKNGVDLAAVGDTVTGKAGDVVKVTVGVGNNGPATLDFGRSGSPVTKVDVAIPNGTTAVAVPNVCQPRKADGEGDWEKSGEPGHRSYRCYPDTFLPVGEQQTFEFELRIDKVIVDAAGSVTINAKCTCGGGLDADLDPSNDVAKLLVNPGEGGGGGGLPVTGAATGIVAGVGGLLLAAGAVGFVLARRRRMRFVA